MNADGRTGRLSFGWKRLERIVAARTFVGDDRRLLA
jgi:hypothetical protein